MYQTNSTDNIHIHEWDLDPPAQTSFSNQIGRQTRSKQQQERKGREKCSPCIEPHYYYLNLTIPRSTPWGLKHGSHSSFFNRHRRWQSIKRGKSYEYLNFRYREKQPSHHETTQSPLHLPLQSLQIKKIPKEKVYLLRKPPIN